MKFSDFLNENQGGIANNVTKMKGIFIDCPLEKNPPKWYKD